MKLLETIFTPQESVNDDFLSLLTVLVSSGDEVKKGQLLAELETSKAVVEVHSPANGYVAVYVKAETDVRVGTKMFELFDSPITGNIAESPSASDVNISGTKKSVKAASFKTKFSKTAQEYIDKNKIDIKKFSGLMFVTTKDIISKPQKDAVSSSQKSAAPVFVKEINPSEKEIKQLSSAKKREFEYLYNVNSSSVISRLSVFIKVSNKENIGLAQQFIVSTPLPTVLQETSKLLLKYPNLNSFYSNGSQAFYKNVNVGFALDDGKNGLKVAALFDSDRLSAKEIEECISDLSVKYTNNQLSVQELTSSTFTITDLFNSNVLSFHPLININNAAILGITAYSNGGFVVDLSFDHRITSGREVALFLEDLKFRLESRFNQAHSAVTIPDIKCQKCFRDINDDAEGNVYFQKVVNSKLDGYICSNCLNGW